MIKITTIRKLDKKNQCIIVTTNHLRNKGGGVNTVTEMFCFRQKKKNRPKRFKDTT